jgi:micrococcal nuclease
VSYVVDGDTIHVIIDGVDYSVRYIGVDTPETGEPGALAATNFNEYLVAGKTVTLVKDTSEVDQYDRLLRYVFVGDVFVNYAMVTNGYATAGSWPPDTACDSTFASAQAMAKASLLGMWAPTATYLPYVAPAATSAPSSNSVGGNCDPSYPDVCIPPYPPDLDCGDISYRRFRVIGNDPHNFDGDHDGVGCESG